MNGRGLGGDFPGGKIYLILVGLDQRCTLGEIIRKVEFMAAGAEMGEIGPRKGFSRAESHKLLKGICIKAE